MDKEQHCGLPEREASGAVCRRAGTGGGGGSRLSLSLVAHGLGIFMKVRRQMPFRRLGESEGKIFSSVLRCLRLILPKKQDSPFSSGSSVAETKSLVLLEMLGKSTT